MAVAHGEKRGVAELRSERSNTCFAADVIGVLERALAG